MGALSAQVRGSAWAGLSAFLSVFESGAPLGYGLARAKGSAWLGVQSEFLWDWVREHWLGRESDEELGILLGLELAPRLGT